MKPSGPRAIPSLLLLLALFPVSLSAISVFDVIRLSQQKYSDSEIVRIIQATDSRFVLGADDTTRLKKEGVTEVVIREMLSRPAREKADAPAARPSAKPARPPAAVKGSKTEASTETRVPSPDPASILDEIVRLTKSGLSEETVLAYAKARRGDLPSVISADRLRRLRESGVSEAVVRYLTAIDVRASDEGAGEDTVEAYVSDSGEAESRSSAPYWSPAGDYDSGTYDAGYYGGGGSYDGYPAGGYYPASDYACYYGDYPFYGSVFYSYPVYFFVNRADFFSRFHRRGHDFRRHRGDIGHRRGFGRPDFPRDRQAINRPDRGPRGRGSIIAGQGWRNPPALARGNVIQGSRQPRGPVMFRGGPGRSAIPPRGFSQISRPPLGGLAAPRAPVRPGAPGGRSFSGGPSPGSAVARAPIARSGGSPSPGPRPGPVSRR
jgi:hypothetical protein